MKTTKSFTSVAQIVRTTSGKEFADAFQKRISARGLVKRLSLERVRKGMTQSDIAGKIGCGQPRISKLEANDDADVRLGELVEYLSAIGMEMQLFLQPTGMKLTDKVKMHAAMIQRSLDRIVELAGSDPAMVEAGGEFMREASFNLGRIVERAHSKLVASNAKSDTLTLESFDEYRNRYTPISPSTPRDQLAESAI